MMNRIPIYRPWLGQAEKDALAACVDREWLSGGPNVKEFERKIAELCETKYAVACSNGTTALYLALLALGVGAGSEVIVPDFTFAASANAVAWTGGRPVFVDIDRATLNLDPNLIDCHKSWRTAAIMPVHIYGQSVDMKALFDHAGKIPIIEDACQGHGVTWMGKHVGGLGNVGCLSFYVDKTITTSEGGMVVTNDEAVARKCLILKHQGRTGRGWYIHDEIGYNFRLTDLAAGIGLMQLKRMTQIIEWKKQHERTYEVLLKEAPGLTLPYVDQRCRNVPFRHNIFVDNPDGLIEHLNRNGVEAKRVFYPLHRQPCYQYLGLKDEQFPNSIRAYERGVSLPSSPLLTDSQVEYVCAKVQEFQKGRSR